MRYGDDLSVILCRHCSIAAAEPVKLSSEYDVVIWCLLDRMNCSVETLERQILPTILPDYGVARVAA